MKTKFIFYTISIVICISFFLALNDASFENSDTNGDSILDKKVVKKISESTNSIEIKRSVKANSKDVLITGWGDLNPGAAFTNFVNHISGLGFNVTTLKNFPSSLTGYEILILVGGYSANEDIPEGDVDAFVSDGNGLIVFEGVVWSGDFLPSASSNPVQNTSGWTSRSNAYTVVPGNPLCMSVSSNCSFIGYSTQATMKTGSQIAMRWNDGTVFAATYEYAGGKVVYINDLWAWYYTNMWDGDPTNGRKIMENALNYVKPQNGWTGAKFDFNDGTKQGWTLAGAFDENGNGPFPSVFSLNWRDNVNYPNPPGLDPAGNNHGSIYISTISGHGITNPGADWWIMQFHSPDLTSNSTWQNANGYSVKIAECMAIVPFATLYSNLFVLIYDIDQAKDRYFFNGTAQALNHDIYGDNNANWNHLTFDWSVITATNYIVKEIFINIWGKMAEPIEGGLYIDEVTPIINPCQITILSPNGGEDITCNTTITWTSTGASGNVKLQYYCNGVWSTIVNSTPNDGSYSWNIPSNTFCDSKIKIIDVANTGCWDMSDNYFKINCGNGLCIPPYIKAGKGEAAAGMNLEVPIYMKGNTIPVDAFGFDFKYCADKLHLLDVIKTDLSSGFSFFQFQETIPGEVTIGGFHTTAIPMNSDGVIALVKLHVDACNEGETCALNISRLVDDLIDMNQCNGTFTCGIPCNLGDVNNDNSITPGDALCAFQIYLNGGTPPTGTDCDNECALYAADVNCTPNGITPGDALYIFQAYLNGESAPLPCNPSALAKNNEEITLAISSVESKPGEKVTFSIELDRFENIQAFGLDLGYPSDLLTFIEIRPNVLTRDWEQLDGQVNVEGVVTIGGFTTSRLKKVRSTNLVDIIFRVNDIAAEAGELWLFNLTDNLANANSRSGQLLLLRDGIRRVGGFEIPATYYLEQNYPNPFNMDTEIVYQLPEEGFVTILIYNSVGHQIRSLVNQQHSAGKYKVSWDGKDDHRKNLPSGIYLYRIMTNDFSDCKKMLLVK